MRQYTEEQLKEWVKISEHKFLNSDGEEIGKLAVLKTNHYEPASILNFAVEKYVGDKYYNEFIDIKCDDPWTRVIISNINDLPYHTLESLLRDRKISDILS